MVEYIIFSPTGKPMPSPNLPPTPRLDPTGDLIRREETAVAVEIVDGQSCKRSNGRMDYTLRVKVTSEAQPTCKRGLHL